MIILEQINSPPLYISNPLISQDIRVIHCFEDYYKLFFFQIFLITSLPRLGFFHQYYTFNWQRNYTSITNGQCKIAQPLNLYNFTLNRYFLLTIFCFINILANKQLFQTILKIQQIKEATFPKDANLKKYNYKTYSNNKMEKVQLGTSMQSADLQQPQLAQYLNSNNTEALKKIIYKYQTRIKQLLKTISKQKKVNDQLRQQLKQLNQTLNQLITKVTTKNKQQKQDPIKDEVIKKELDNEMRKNNALKKEMETMKAKIKSYESQKLSDLHNQIREKNKVIEDLHQSLRLHERIQKKQMTLDIYRKQQQAQKQITTLSQQVSHLRKLVQQQRKNQDLQDRSILFQQKKMNEIETKQKSLPKVNQNGQQAPKQTYTLMQQQIKSLKQQLQMSEKQKKIADKSFKTDLQTTRNRLKISEKTNSQLRQQLYKKQKQSNLLSQKLKILQKHSATSQKQLILEQTTLTWPQLIDCRRQLKGASNIKPAMKRFDDSQKISQNLQFKIRSLTFKYFEQHIIELRITYDTFSSDSKTDKKQQTVTSFSLPSQYQSAKEATLQLGQYQYITEWEVYLGKGIQFVRIRTSKEQILQAGNERSSLKCKRLPFDIKSFEKPIACFGVIDTRSFGQKEKQVLIAIGLILKRKNVFGGRAKSLIKFQKPYSTTLVKINDKNV